MVRRGFGFEWVMRLTLGQLGSLISSVQRIESSESITNTWSRYVGAQGSHRGVKSFTSSLAPPKTGAELPEKGF